jgi:sugar transferase (PEP-CTERM/EpsH1 system associated)
VTAESDPRPLVLHVVTRFDTGGLENGVVNLINHMPASAYRHAVLALTEVTAFSQRVRVADVSFMALHKAPGHGFKLYPRVWRLLRDLKPALVHTRNLGPLEMQVAVAAAGGAARVHGEHGRELDDLDGSNKSLQRVRRLYAPFVHRYVALSRDLQRYLTDRVGIDKRRIAQIYNGVDVQRFRPPGGADPGPASAVADWPFDAHASWVIGTVGRMQGVKDQTLLAKAFVRAVVHKPELKTSWRLVLVGDGPLRAECQRLLNEAGLAHLAWLPGDRSDVPEVMRHLHCFVLPSKAEGISNTILEAMACGLPVVATDVGGNAELVQSGLTGELVPAQNEAALAQALLGLYAQGDGARQMGQAGRAEVERRFSLQAMVAAYQALYDEEINSALARAGRPRKEH